MISPLPADLVEPEQLVVVHITDEVADTREVHLPAATANKDGRGWRFTDYDFPPAYWPSACRKVRSGSVYARAGMLTDAPVCLACEETL